jgi:hypothetical protein
MEFNKNDPKVARFTKGYNGRKSVKVRTAQTLYISNYWDGGSKTSVSFYNLAGQPLSYSDVKFVKQTAGNPFNQNIGEVEIQENVVAVERVIFCGKDLGVSLIIHPNQVGDFT